MTKTAITIMSSRDSMQVIDEMMTRYLMVKVLHCTLGEIHFSLLSPDEKNTELKKILTKIHLFPLDYFYSNIGTKL